MISANIGKLDLTTTNNNIYFPSSTWNFFCYLHRWGPNSSNRRSANLEVWYLKLRLTSKLNLKKKHSTYICLPDPTWTQASQIFKSAKTTNIRKLHSFQSRKSPWYVFNIILHKDLVMPTFNDHMWTHYKQFYSNLMNIIKNLFQICRIIPLGDLKVPGWGVSSTNIKF